LLLKFIFTMLKTALKVERKNFFWGRPQKIGRSYGKRERKFSLGRKFQGFCDFFNGIRAMTILLFLFCMSLGVIFMVFNFLPHGSENVFSALFQFLYV